MSKLKSSNSVNVATSKTTAFQSTTTTTKTVKTEAGLMAAAANINVNQKEAFLLQQQQIKKKRTALENISNAGSNASGSGINANKETKKSRFGNAVFGNTVTNVLSKKAAAENVNPTGLAKKPSEFRAGVFFCCWNIYLISFFYSRRSYLERELERPYSNCSKQQSQVKRTKKCSGK